MFNIYIIIMIMSTSSYCFINIYVLLDVFVCFCICFYLGLIILFQRGNRVAFGEGGCVCPAETT